MRGVRCCKLKAARQGGAQDAMWTDYRKAPNLMIAEMWKNLLEGEGLPAAIIPEGDILDWGERVPFRVLVPKGREHVADEILRKL